MRRVREHRALGHRTILITGALDFAVEGLRPLFDEIVAAEMSIRPDGTYSGEMITVPPTGEARAQILADYCDAEGLPPRGVGGLRRLDESTCRCSRPSASPSPSTPRPASRRSPASGAGSSSTGQGTRRPATAAADRPAAVERQRRERFGAAESRRRGTGRVDEGARRSPARSAASAWPASRRRCRRPAATKLGPLELRGTSTRPSSRPRLARRAHPPRRHLRVRPVDVEGHASPYFDDWVSFPFVPGHEVVGELDDGTRVVLEPVLGHEARGFAPPFEGAAPGDGDDYAHLATGHLEPGIQTGFCCSTGGGWAR